MNRVLISVGISPQAITPASYDADHCIYPASLRLQESKKEVREGSVLTSEIFSEIKVQDDC